MSVPWPVVYFVLQHPAHSLYCYCRWPFCAADSRAGAHAADRTRWSSAAAGARAAAHVARCRVIKCRLSPWYHFDTGVGVGTMTAQSAGIEIATAVIVVAHSAHVQTGRGTTWGNRQRLQSTLDVSARDCRRWRLPRNGKQFQHVHLSKGQVSPIWPPPDIPGVVSRASSPTPSPIPSQCCYLSSKNSWRQIFIVCLL